MSKPSKYLQVLAAHVATGQTIKAAAELVGCSASVAYQCSRLDEFQNEVARLKTEAVAAAVGVLSSAASKAAETLVAMLDEENDPKDRLAAARLILANLQPVAEYAELRQRLDRLESQGTGLRVAR